MVTVVSADSVITPGGRAWDMNTQHTRNRGPFSSDMRDMSNK